MKYTLIALVLSVLFVAASPAAGQDPPEVLTNADILTLAEAGLPTMLILAKIELTRTDFDTTVDALVALFEAGVDPTVLVAMTRGRASLSASIDFGDDTSDWARDGECDDPRFRGLGMAAATSPADRGRDATDCRALFESGDITLRPTPGEPD